MREQVGYPEADDAPPIDPAAIEEAYAQHRARRRARRAHVRRSRWAGARFWVILILLVAACVFLALTTWREVARLFGL
jgi:anti-sigma-K factor RskA